MKKMMMTLAAALAATLVAAPVHAYTAEDCERGYRIYNHPSKGEQRLPVSMKYCPIEGTNPQSVNPSATLSINTGMMTLKMPPARVVSGTTMKTAAIQITFSNVLNIVAYRGANGNIIPGRCTQCSNATEVYGEPHGSANYARGACGSGDQISAAHQTGHFKEIGSIGFGETKSFDMNKYLCGNPQPGTTFRVEFRGKQGSFRRGMVYDYPFPRGNGCHGYYCFVTVTLE